LNQDGLEKEVLTHLLTSAKKFEAMARGSIPYLLIVMMETFHQEDEVTLVL
jgi:uncharacterized membrane protein